MSHETFKRIVYQLREAGVDQLGLFYINEPFLSDDLPEAIAWAKDVARMPYVFLTTNGVCATPDRVLACIEAGLDSLKVAFNRAPLGNAGGPSAVEAVIDNVRAARRVRDEVAGQTGHRCRLSASTLDFGAVHREQMAPALAAVGAFVDEHYWLPAFGAASWASAFDASNDDTSLPKPVPCWTLFSEAHVRADGKLSACCLDASDRFVMADLNVTPLDAAWHGEPFRALRTAHLNGNLRGTVCEQCIAYRVPHPIDRSAEFP